MKNKVVLVTGAAGFIGQHVARTYLSAGWEVHGIGRGGWAPTAELDLHKWHCSEVTLSALVELGLTPDVIVHCAGGASVGVSIQQPGLDFDYTVKSMSNVLEFIRLHSPATCLIYPSSAAVYGQVTQMPIKETVYPNAVSPYGLHKRMAELLCELYSRQYGIHTAIVRLFSIYGPGLRKQLLWDACLKYEGGCSEFFGTGNEVRDWLHVCDIAKLLFLAKDKASIACPIVNAGSGIGIKVSDILIQLGLNLESDLVPTFSEQARAGDPGAFIADISEARSWGWEPEIFWRDGLSEYVDWFKKWK